MLFSGQDAQSALRSSYEFDVIHVTNELASSKTGGVGTVVDDLASGLRKLGLRALWFLVNDHADHSPPRSLGDIVVATGRLQEITNATPPLFCTFIAMNRMTSCWKSVGNGRSSLSSTPC